MKQWVPLAFVLLIASGASAQDVNQINLSVLQGDGQVAASGRIFAQRLTVRFTDGSGIPFQGTPVYFENEGCFTLGGLPCEFPAPPGHFESGSDNATVLTDSSGVAIAPPYYAGTGSGSMGVSAYALSGQPPYFFYFSEVVGHIVDFHLTETRAVAPVPSLSFTSLCVLIALIVVGTLTYLTGRTARAGTNAMDITAIKRSRPRRWIPLLSILSAAVCPHVYAGLHRGAEYDSLVNFYNSTNGTSRTNHSGWLSGDACGWLGITCDQDSNPHDNTSHVTSVVLGADNLTGTVPTSVSLPKLMTFDVNYNQLTGSIPSLAGMTNLSVFYVYGNQLTGPIPPLAGMTNLTNFEAMDNQLTGPIPSLAGMTNLQVFGVSGNQLTGSIPSLVGLANLQTFDAGSNQLSGSIPSLTGLTSLQNFNVQYNQLTGALPSVSGLTNLQNIYVHHNQLTGPIPSLSGLTTLVVFWASSNKLTGSIPSLAGLDILQHFYVDRNHLSGAVPPAPAMLRDASLCPNLFDITPQPTIDPIWDSLTYYTPWWAIPYHNNQCDDIFTDGYGDPIIY